MSSRPNQSWQTKHEHLIEKHQQLLERFYNTILNEDEDTDVSDEIAQLSSLIGIAELEYDIKEARWLRRFP